MPCKTQLFDTVAEKYSSTDISIIWFLNKKIIHSGEQKTHNH